MRTVFTRVTLAFAVLLTLVVAAPQGAGASIIWWPQPKPKPAPPPAPDCGATIAKAAGGTWVCSFDDEFNGTTLDTTKWSIVTSATGAPVNNGACYTTSPNNVSVAGGYLNLTVRQESTPMSCKLPLGYTATTSYTSGDVATYGKFSQTYGRFAVRASFPATTVAGLQASLWMYPNTNVYGAWPLSGELDIAEEYSRYADRVIPYLHYNYDTSTVDKTTSTNVVTNNYCMITDVNAFHEYAVEWTQTAITILYDGQVCMVDKPSALGLTGVAPFNTPFYMILTQALGITGNAFNAATTPLPATTRVDYVRAWK
jgi:beta-glucanase (GH16 family)